MARGIMCILKGFSRLVICTDVKDRFITETFSFKNNCAEKACLVLWNFGRKFNCRMEVVSLFNEQVNFLSVTVLQWENVINKTFPFYWFCCFDFSGHFCTHCSSMGLKIIVSNKLEWIFLKDKFKHFFEVVWRYRRFIACASQREPKFKSALRYFCCCFLPSLTNRRLGPNTHAGISNHYSGHGLSAKFSSTPGNSTAKKLQVWLWICTAKLF